MNPKKSVSILATLKHIVINIGRLLRMSWEMDRYTTCMFYLVACIGALVPVMTSYLLTYAIDHIQLAQYSAATVVPVIIIGVLGARSVIYILEDIVYSSYARTYLDHIFRYKLQNKISYDYYKKVVSLDIAQLENPDIQDLITKVKDIMLWRVTDYIRTFSYLFANTVAYVSAFVVMWQFGWWIPFLITVITLPRMYIRTQYGNILWSVWDGSTPQSRRLWYLGWILQDKIAVREMKVAQTSETILGKFKELQDTLFNLNRAPLGKYMRALIAPPIAEGLVILLIIVIFLPNVVTQVITIGSFTLLLTMLGQLNSNTASAAYNISELYENNLYVNQYFELLKLQPHIVSSSSATKLTGQLPPKIEFKNVSFAYPGGKNILHGVSFVIEPGQSVAFVGENGAGKSTIIKLLCRFYDVTDGEVLINDINIKDIDIQSWYTYLGTLFQEFVWYHLSVKDNISLGASVVGTKKDMIEAAKKAGAHEFIMKLPQKYDQPLGREYEDGEELSGGQWQKLAIARAFYQQPPILILDEPTSAIDAEAEYEIFNNLEKHYANGKSLILISHRFSTVRNAEKIFVLEDGKIAEQGAHSYLLKLQGKYARMFAAQAEGYK